MSGTSYTDQQPYGASVAAGPSLAATVSGRRLWLTPAAGVLLLAGVGGPVERA